MPNVGGSLELACWKTRHMNIYWEYLTSFFFFLVVVVGFFFFFSSACRLRLRCCCSTQILDTQAQKHATWVEKIPLMRPNRALWTLIKDNASYELTRACGKLCRIPCLKSTFAASKCLFCGLQSTTNSGLQSTEHGDDLHQDRGRLTRGSGLLPLASHLDRWLAMHTCIGYKIPKLLVGSSVNLNPK